jgi:hypothetical protein
MINNIDNKRRKMRSLMLAIGLVMSGYLFAQPTISSIDPKSGSSGSTLTISGSNFGSTAASNRVFVGHVEAEVTEATETELKVTVPSGISRDKITVKNGILTGYANDPFILKFGGESISSSTFSTASTSSLSSLTEAWTVNSADFNGDGLLDLMVGYFDNSSISIYRNESSSGTVSFSAKSDFNIGSGKIAREAKAGDFDGDGKLDMAVVDAAGNSVTVYRNTTPDASSTISFSTIGTFTVGSTPNSLDIDDINGDGKPDIVTVGGTTLAVLTNTSTGTGVITFATASTATAPASSLGVSISDLDLDGDKDIIVASNSSGGVSYYTNSTTPGSSTLSFSKDDVSISGAIFDVDIADIDNDGKPDVLLSKPLENIVLIYKNTSSTSIAFGSNFTLTTDDRPNGVHANDLDGDGLLDIVVTSGTLNKISVFKNGYDGTLSSSTFGDAEDFSVGSVTPIYLNSGDFNSDGKSDIIVANEGEGFVTVLPNETVLVPTISSISPLRTRPGATVTITGANFSETISDNAVDFNGTAATITSATSTSLDVTVPDDATTGQVSVSVGGVTGTFEDSFHVMDSLFVRIDFEGTYEDASGSGFATEGAGSFVADRYDTESVALSLNGSSDSVVVSSTDDLSASGLSGSITVSAWIKPSDFPSGETTIVSNYDGSAGFSLVMTNITDGVANELKGEVFGTDTYAFGGFPQETIWNHVAMVFNAGDNSTQLYLNGSQVADVQNGSSADIWSSTNNITIGYNENYSHFPGEMDEVWIYDQALGLSDIQAIYNEGNWPNDFRSDPAVFDYHTTGGTGLSPEGSIGDDYRYSDVLDLSDSSSLAFYYNNSITTVWGDDNNDGYADAGGDAIDIPAEGKYFVSTNIKSNEYVVAEITTVGIIGSVLTGDDSGWNGDDVDLTDEGDGNFQLNDVDLLAGEFKFRANDQWLEGNWGDDDADGSLEIAGANIVVDNSGSYNISINISNKTYTLEENTGGLVGYYTFDNGSLADQSGRGFDGTLPNGGLFSQDRYGNEESSFEPENNGSYIEIDHGGAWDFRDVWTITGWIRPNSYPSDNGDVWDVVFSIPETGFHIVLENQSLMFVWSDGSTQLRARCYESISRNQWSYFSVTVNESGELEITVNGILQQYEYIDNVSGGIISANATSATISPILDHSTIASISRANLDTYQSSFNGDIDDLRVYTDFSLSASEIQSIYEDEVSGGSDRLVAQYFFTDGSLADITNNTYDGVTRDQSGNEISLGLETGIDGDGNGALSFSNNGDYMDVYHERTINTNNNYTLNMWIKPAALPEAERFGDALFTDGDDGRIMYNSDGKLFYHYYDNSGYPVIESDVNSVVPGEWQMITASVDNNGNLKIYHNGVLVLSVDISDQSDELSEFFIIAPPDNNPVTEENPDGDGERFYNGAIDDVSIYRRVLSESEVFEQYAGDVLSEGASNVEADVYGPTQIQVNWVDNATDETYYEVKWLVDGAEVGNSGNLDANSQDYLIQGLTTGTTYEIVVGTGNSEGVSSPDNRPLATPVDLGDDPVTIEPSLWTLDDVISITVDVDKLYPPGDLSNASKVYLHSGPVARGNENSQGWTEATGNAWGEDNGSGEMSDNGDGTWSITIDDPRTYYGVDQNFDATQLGMIFRNEDGSAVGLGEFLGGDGRSDIFLDAFDPTLINRPSGKYADLTRDDVYMFTDGTVAPNVSAWADINSITLEAWVNFREFPESGCHPVFARYGADTSTPLYGMMVCNNGGTYSLDFWIKTTDGTDYLEIPVTSDDIDQWNHFAFTFDGSEAIAYQNGAYIDSGTTTASLPASEGTSEILISNFTGKIDVVRLWNFAKSANQIRSDIGLSDPSSTIGLNGLWKLNEVFDVTGGQVTPEDIFGNDLTVIGSVIPSFPDLEVFIGAVNGGTDVQNFQLFPGLENTVSVSFFNNGDAEINATGSIINKLYLSTDQVLSASDDLLGSESYEIDLEPNSNNIDELFTFTISDDVPVGDYQLIISLDDEDNISELDDLSNNLLTYEVEMADLPPINAPTSLASANITASSFDVSWVIDDVTDDNLALTLISEWQLSDDASYSNIVQSNDAELSSSINVSSLQYNTDYFFRVRAITESDDDPRFSSWTELDVTTLDDTEVPVIQSIVPATNKTEPTDVEVVINASDDFAVSYVEFFKRGSSADGYIKETLSGPNTAFSTTVLSSDFGETGVEMYAVAFDAAGNASEAFGAFITREFPANTQGEIPEGNIGKGQDEISYSIFAFPFETTSLSDVVSAPQNSENWIIYEWTGSSYNDYPNNLTFGKGYWILVNDESVLPLTFPNASAAPIDGQTGYEVELNEIWTLIGNPSTLGNLNWTTVLEHNVTIGVLDATSDIEQLQVYNSGYTSTNTLNVYEGAFVKSNVGAVTLEIPLTAISGARVEQELAAPRDYFAKEDGWEIVMDITSDSGLRYGVAGFGAHPEADDQKDDYDMGTPILFEKFIKAEFHENSLGNANVARSIHQIKDNDIWESQIYTHFEPGTLLTITFNGVSQYTDSQKLVLFDPQKGTTVALTKDLNYTIAYQPGYELKFVKGTQTFIEENTQLEQVLISDLYPNPSNGIFNFELVLPNAANDYLIEVEMLDLSGRLIEKMIYDQVPAGSLSLKLDFTGKNLKPGLYVFEIYIRDQNSAAMGNHITKKGYLISR